MNIVVCIKQVPDSDRVRIDHETNRINRAGVPNILNPFDEDALLIALKLKAETGGKITVISMGPPNAEKVLRTALLYGADECILISDPKFSGSDTYATSYILSLALKNISAVDLILFGKQAIDGDTGQVGPSTAAFLDIPILTNISKIKNSGATLKVNKQTESGYEVWDIDKPCALTIAEGSNPPLTPCFERKAIARSVVIPCWGTEDLLPDFQKIGSNGSPTKVNKIFPPPKKANRKILSGEPADIVKTLIHDLRERHIL
ncbi:MAG TPA: electron transfer flavoprotein subunit beta/FixA family protein [Pontiella sp.]